MVSVSHFSFDFSAWKPLFIIFGMKGGCFPLIGVMLLSVFNPSRKPIPCHDPAHCLPGNNGFLPARQCVYPAVSITPTVFMEMVGNLFASAGMLVLFFEGNLLIITVFWQFKLF